MLIITKRKMHTADPPMMNLRQMRCQKLKHAFIMNAFELNYLFRSPDWKRCHNFEVFHFMQTLPRASKTVTVSSVVDDR